MTKHISDFPPAARELMNRFSNRQARLSVVGLGYVGLPLAVLLAEAGFSVVGIDSDPEKIEELTQRRSYVEDVPSEQVVK